MEADVAFGFALPMQHEFAFGDMILQNISTPVPLDVPGYPYIIDPRRETAGGECPSPVALERTSGLLRRAPLRASDELLTPTADIYKHTDSADELATKNDCGKRRKTAIDVDVLAETKQELSCEASRKRSRFNHDNGKSQTSLEALSLFLCTLLRPRNASVVGSGDPRSPRRSDTAGCTHLTPAPGPSLALALDDPIPCGEASLADALLTVSRHRPLYRYYR
jgi:hypothetical protein